MIFMNACSCGKLRNAFETTLHRVPNDYSSDYDLNCQRL